MDITIQFPQPDYAVVFVGQQAVKSFTSSDFGPEGDPERRKKMAHGAKVFADGIVEGFSQARSLLGNNIPSLRTKI